MTSAAHSGAGGEASTPPDRSRRMLERGVLLYRWVALAWMGVAAATTPDPFRNEALAWASVGGAAAWTAWLTFGGGRDRTPVLLFDLAVATWLTLASALVVPEGDVVAGRPFFAVGYPLSSALLWGVQRGPVWGLVAGGVLGTAFAATRPLNGVPLDELPARQVQHVVGGILNYLAAGGAVGLVAGMLRRSAAAVHEATEAAARDRERAARLAERESLAREIHDSVLQALALVHKRGRELAHIGPVPPAEVAALADIAGDQEGRLRNLVLRPPEDPPAGRASLRAALEEAAGAVSGVDVTVAAVGPIWLDRGCVEEIAAAAKQALDNVAEHAEATKAHVFADDDGDRIVVSVRDDGAGFTFDERTLEAAGRAGILKSMKGRVEDLGGTMTIDSSPGRGTEVEFVVPAGADRR